MWQEIERIRYDKVQKKMKTNKKQTVTDGLTHEYKISNELRSQRHIHGIIVAFESKKKWTCVLSDVIFENTR